MILQVTNHALIPISQTIKTKIKSVHDHSSVHPQSVK